MQAAGGLPLRWSGVGTFYSAAMGGDSPVPHVRWASQQAYATLQVRRVAREVCHEQNMTMKSPGVIEPMTGVTSALVIDLVKAD